MKNLIYVDTCIYLNLWLLEGNEKFGTPYWKIAEDFFKMFDNEDTTIYYSGFVLKELKHILSEEEYKEKSLKFKTSPNFIKLFASAEDFNLARKIEREVNYGISFFDILHLILAKKSGSVLITRDKGLLRTAGKYGVIAKKPEEML